MNNNYYNPRYNDHRKVSLEVLEILITLLLILLGGRKAAHL